MSDSASIRIPPLPVQNTLIFSDFTVFAWVWVNQTRPEAGIIQLPGVLEVACVDDSAVRVTLRRAASSGPLVATTSGGVAAGEWALVSAAFTRSEGRLDIRIASVSGGIVTASAAAVDYTNVVLGPISDDLGLGAHPAGIPGLVGVYGPIVIRRHRTTLQDFETVWESRRCFGVIDIDTRAGGGFMDGTAGLIWLANHAIATAPADGGVGGDPHLRASHVNGPVTRSNFTIAYGADFPAGLFAVTRPLNAAEGFTYVSHRDQPTDGFFTVDTPGTGISLEPVEAVAPAARQLATGPTRLLRVMTSANSRAARTDDGSGLSPGNYAHGFIEVLRPNIAGVLFRPAIVDFADSASQPWFGLDCREDQPRTSGPGSIERTVATPSAWKEFSRFWTGSPASGSSGPGNGLVLRPGAYFGLRCRPEPGSLLVETEPLTIQAYVLRFPGSCAAMPYWDRGSSQGSPGTSGPLENIDLDSTAWTYTLTPDDAVIENRTFDLPGDLRAQIAPSHMCFVADGPGLAGMGIVTQVRFKGTRTTVELDRSMVADPGPGSMLKFGPWSYEAIEHTWEGLPPNDPESWRGLRITASPDGGAGLILFAYSAWRPNANRGFVVGTCGWAGNGYAVQIKEAHPDSVVPWMRLTGADVWIQAPAQQRSPTSSMSSYAALIRESLPGVDLVWAGEMEHESSDFKAWHQYILNNAAAHGAVGISLLEDPRVGALWEQFADGLRAEGSHLSQRGNARLAQLWIERLGDAAIDPCSRADQNNDGVLNIFDFLEFQTAFSEEDTAADINGDGSFNVFDFLAFQNLFGGCG